MSIAVDLDGTSAEYHGFEGNHIIGPPIDVMWLRIARWIDEGEEVWLFTARADSKESIDYIKKWMKYHDLPVLPVTNIKFKHFQEFWDDRAIRVEVNTGLLADSFE